MNFFAFFGVLIVSTATVKSYTDTSNLTEDGCNHFRKLHGTTYTWSCEKSLFCPKNNIDLIMKLHTASELSCGSRDSNKICCPKTFVIGATRTRRGVYNNYMIPALSSFDYYVRQLSTAPQAEIQRSTVVSPVSSIYSLSRANLARFGGNTIYDPAQSTPQNVYVDCKTLDSAHLNDTFTWNCQTGPCKIRPQSYFVKKNYHCDRLDKSKICCPEFRKETDLIEKKATAHDFVLRAHSDSTREEIGTTDKTREYNFGEQPILFRHGSKFATTIKPNPLANVVRPTSDELISPELREKRFSKFDHDLLSVLLKDNPTKNVVVSPASIKVLLALLAEGSTGDTSDEILHALQFTRTVTRRQQTVHPSLRKLQAVFQGNSSSINLESRSRIYTAKDVDVREEYENIVKNIYNADIETLDFSDPEDATNVINGWVNNATHGLIPTLVDKENLRKDMKLYLLNYVYLKANWDIEFNPSFTHPGCFYRSNNDCEKVKFMSIKRTLNYTNSEMYKTEVFEIPFKDPRYRVVFMLPHEGVSVHEVLQNLARQDFIQLFGKLEAISIKLNMPRTTIELSTNLLRTLQQLHITTVFGPKANLDRMLKSNQQLSVNDMVHKARIEMNEEGAKAAAVSGGGVQVLSLDMDEKIVVNRPFLFFIRDTTVAGFLFEGVVFSPDKVDS